MASLTVIRGPDRGMRFDITLFPAGIGRDAKNLVRLHDNEISRCHAELRRTPKGVMILDLKSSNGTFVNANRIEASLLKNGDRVSLGQSELIFTSTSPLAAAERPPASLLAQRVNLVTRTGPSDASAIVRSINPAEANQYLRYPERAESPWLKEALAKLTLLYETSQAVSRIPDIQQLLEHLLDQIFASVHPDRGCVMLRDAAAGPLQPVVARFAAEGDACELHVSRTIVDWVLVRNEGIVIIDADQDVRFREVESVAQLGVREVICVPLRGRHETFGVLYLDIHSDVRDLQRTRVTSKFSADHLRLIMTIGHQAGLAIEDSRYYEALVQAERLAAVGQTIASLSHHIKNILQGLKSGAYVLETGLQEHNLDVVAQGWQSIQKNQHKIYHLVMDMLSFSKEREPALENTALNPVVEDVVQLLQPRAREERCQLECRLDPSLPTIAIDPEGIHRAVLNIVSNAIDAVQGVPQPRLLIETAVDVANNLVCVRVTDNGVGIAQDQQERIFEVFVSTKGSRGTGLGLAVSRKILREHGGAIRIISTPGQGAQFILELPIRQVAAPSLDELQTLTGLQLPVDEPPAPDGSP